MADVKIVDIDGSQWSMKDQVARDKITELEGKTTVKITKKIDTNKVKMNLIEINGEKFIQLHFNGLDWSGNIAESVVSFKNDFGMESIVRCLIGIDFYDMSGRDTINIDIEPSGNIRVYPNTPNQMQGMYKKSRIYGDAFVKMAY